MNTISEIELAWLAGILEGEGSFMNSRNTVNKKVYFYPKITVNMSDQDVVERVARLFETKVYVVPPDPRNTSWKQLYRAHITGSRAAEFMERLLPYMGARRSDKINEILVAYKS